MKTLLVLFLSFVVLPKAFSKEAVSVLNSKQVIELSAVFQVSSEHDELDSEEVEKEGWRLGENHYGDPVYILNLSVKTSDLPISKQLGSAYLKISRTGLVGMGTSIGDQDAGSSANLQLPQKDKKLLEVSDLNFRSSGGDYASGSWSFSGDLKLSVRQVD